MCSQLRRPLMVSVADVWRVQAKQQIKSSGATLRLLQHILDSKRMYTCGSEYENRIADQKRPSERTCGSTC